MSSTIEEPNPPPLSGKSRMPNVGRAGAIMMASLLLSRVLGIVREMIMNWKFGQTLETDAYRLSFQIPDLLFYLVAGGALSSAFIPVFSEYLHTNREDDAWHVFSVVTTLMTMLVMTFIVLAWVFALPLARQVAPGKPDEIIPLIAYMSRIVLPTQFAFFIGGLMIGTLYSRQVFSVPGLGPNIYNLGIIFGALVLSNFVVPGVVGMSWGALIGAMMGSFLIPALVMRKLGSQFRFSIDLKHPGVRKVFKLMAPVVFGLSLPGVFPIITQYFATFYQEAGVNSAIQNANQMMQAPLGVFGQSLALAAFPALSQFFAQERMDLYRSQLERSLRTVIYLSIPVSALLLVMPTELIRAAFEHGRFLPSDTARTSACLAMYAVGVAAWCLQPVLMRAYFSMQQTLVPIVMGTATTALFVVLSWLFVRAGYSYESLPLAGSLSAIVLVAVMLAGVSKSSGGLDIRAILATLARSITAALLGGAALLGALRFMPWIAGRLGTSGQILATLLLMILFGWVYYGLTRLLRMPESDTINRALARLDRRQPAP